MQKLYEFLKPAIAIACQSLNGLGLGRYYKLSSYSKALLVVVLGPMAAGDTSAIELVQAKDDGGTGSKHVRLPITITANQGVTEGQVVVVAPPPGKTVTINDIVFTVAAVTDAAKHEFADAAGLETCVNHAVHGVPGVTATNDAGTVNLKSTDAGQTTITFESDDAVNLAVSTLEAIAYFEVNASELDHDNGFTHVAASVTNSAAIQTAATLLLGGARFDVDQAVAAADA